MDATPTSSRAALHLLAEYIRAQRKALCLTALGLGTLFLVSWLYRAPWQPALYAAALVLCVGAMFFVVGFIGFAQRHTVLVQLREQCAQALAPLPPTPYLPESDWFALVQALEQARQAEAAQNRRAVQDAVEYYTLWAHQIKTPLAALRLLAQESTDSALRSALLQELFKTEQYVELVLGYLRVGSMCADLCPMHTALNTIVRDSIKKVSPLFIYKKSVHLVVEDIGLSAVTDAKWLGFVLEQLLTNAVKYTPGGTVRLYADEQALYVTDTGIGISANDLPRITERGFTGHNGHAEPHSSGLGLYLCKEVLAKLGHTLSIQSVIGQGTTVRIGFARDALLLDAPLSSHTHLTQL